MDKKSDFIGIGTHKSATTWIYGCLYEHPEIYAPIKESNFFSWNWDKGLMWYESFFKKCPQNCKAGEFSPAYLAHPKAPERIFNKYPNAKLIISLRNPVEKIFSKYRFSIRRNLIKNSLSFENFIKKRPARLKDGLYSIHIKKYLQFFPKNQILILIYEDIAKNPLAFIQKIYKFIDVDDKFIPSIINTKLNEGRIPEHQAIEGLLMKISYSLQMRGFYKILWWAKRCGAENLIKWLNTKNNISRKKGINKSMQKQLQKYYEKDIKELEEILKLNLVEWRSTL